MRIGLIAPVWFPVPPPGYGGIEQVVSLLAEELVARGHEVTLFASGGSRTAATLRSFYEQAPMERLGQSAPEAGHVGLAFRDAVVRYRDGEGFDLLHDHTAHLGVAFAATLDTPVVHTEHFTIDRDKETFYRRFKDDVYLTGISAYQVGACPDLPWRGVVSNAVDVDHMPFRERKDDYLLVLGRVCDRKAQDLAIETARQAGIPLTIAGPVHPFEADFFEAKVLPHVDGEAVTFLGEVSHERKLELLAGARALLFPAREPEPFGLVMAEALACGTPVVAEPVGAVPEIVTEGETGFLAKGPKAAAEAVGRIDAISSARCREEAEARFHPTTMVSGYEAVYRDILAEL